MEGPEGLRARPGGELAESWQMDGDAYIFNLRKNVSWHDGASFTAKDVVFTIDYIKEHPYQWVNSKSVKDAEALDDYTVKLYLNKSYAPFLDMVAGTLPIAQNKLSFVK